MIRNNGAVRGPVQQIPFIRPEEVRGNHLRPEQSSFILRKFQTIKELFNTICATLSHTWKVIAYHSSLIFNVAMNTLLPNWWKWWNEIDDQLYLGAEPLRNKDHLRQLREAGITLIVSKLEDFEYEDGLLTQPFQPNDILAAGIALRRSPTADASPIDAAQLKADVEAIKNEIDKGGKVYVHCKAGRGRSAMTIIAYYADAFKWDFDRAFNYVKDRRHQVYLMPSQERELRNLIDH